MVDRVSKTHLMERILRGEGAEAFEHTEHGWFDVTAMREIAKKRGELVRVDMECVVEFVKANRVTDPQRVLDLKEEAWKDDPILYVRCVEPPPGPTTYLLIDGSHRALRRAMEGMSYVNAYVLEYKDIIRPNWETSVRTRDIFDIDWGDDIVNGQIVKVPK